MAGVPGGGTTRSTSITVPTTISRRTITTIPIVPSPKQGIRIGSITRSTGGMPSTGIRERPRSTGSSVRVVGPGQVLQTPGGMAVGTGAGGGGRPQTSDLSRGGGAGGGGRPQTSDLSRGGGRDNAMSGAGRGGSERASSNRGQSSRGSSSRSSGSLGGGSSSRGGGGGSRGGGGGGGRGGGGRR